MQMVSASIQAKEATGLRLSISSARSILLFWVVQPFCTIYHSTHNRNHSKVCNKKLKLSHKTEFSTSAFVVMELSVGFLRLIGNCELWAEAGQSECAIVH